ncbi:MAG TPA: indole-3-glycerol-phosphate synthase [Deltaproteobacteria bacterium]|nr:indole-3-glycerol-phosphate synthase [Deltaproteobacteria bacterium]
MPFKDGAFMNTGRGRRSSLGESVRQKQMEGHFPVISEIKVRSDKAGDLLCGRDPVALAREMARCSVAGISVVTEPEHFGGNMGLLKAVAETVHVPVLHKDFITTQKQIEESASCGASAILLITVMLKTDSMVGLIEAAGYHGLETLVEVHSLAELETVKDLPFDLLGINNRDITIFEVDDNDVSRTEELAGLCKDRLLISESSISRPEEVRRAGISGADAVLIGTSVLKAQCMSEFISTLTAVGWPP